MIAQTHHQTACTNKPTHGARSTGGLSYYSRKYFGERKRAGVANTGENEKEKTFLGRVGRNLLVTVHHVHELHEASVVVDDLGQDGPLVAQDVRGEESSFLKKKTPEKNPRKKRGKKRKNTSKQKKKQKKRRNKITKAPRIKGGMYATQLNDKRSESIIKIQTNQTNK